MIKTEWFDDKDQVGDSTATSVLNIFIDEEHYKRLKKVGLTIKVPKKFVVDGEFIEIVIKVK